MPTTQQDLQSFTQFVHNQLGDDDSASRLRELLDLWLLENPADFEYAENVAAINASINASINDFMNGERGTPAGEHSRELREEFGVTDE